MIGYSGKIHTDSYKAYDEDCKRLNKLIREQYKSYFLERKAKGIVEEYNEEKYNVGTVLIEDFLHLNLSTQLLYSLLEFYLKYRPTYIPTVLSNGNVPKEAIELMVIKKPETIKLFNRSAVEKYSMKDFVLSHMYLFTYGELPESLSTNSDIKSAFDKQELVYKFNGRDKEGYGRDWLNKDGELKEWFKFSTGFKPKSKEEYMEIFYKYIAEGVTIPSFCTKYRITSDSDFSKFLVRVSVENSENAKMIKELASKSKENFWNSVVQLSEDLATQSMSFIDFIKNNGTYNINMKMVAGCIRNSFSEGDYKEIMNRFAEELYEYIMNNKYSLNIVSLSHFFDAPYLSDNKNINSNELSKVIKDFFMRYGYCFNHERPAREYFKASDIISTYHKSFKPGVDVIFTTLLIDGKEVHVTDEHREQLVAYLESHHLPFTGNLAFHYLKEIVSGNLNYSAETLALKEQKNEAKKALQESVGTCHGPQDYFKVMDTMEAKKLKKELK